MVLMHPSTVLTYKPTWVLYHDFVCTGKNYIRTLSKLNPEWLFTMSEKFYGNIEKDFKGNMKKHLLKTIKEINSKEENEEEEEKGKNKK